MAVLLEVLRRMGLDAPAGALEQRWSACYGGDRIEAYRADTGPLAEALLRTPRAPLGDGVALADVLTLDDLAQDSAERQARDVLVKKQPDPTDARRVHAAVRLAFDTDPKLLAHRGAAARALSTLWDGQNDGVRRAPPAPRVEDLEPVDEAAGAAIYDAMRGLDGADVVEEQP